MNRASGFSRGAWVAALSLAVAAFASATAPQEAPKLLAPGDKAPKLEVAEFIKGDAVKEFKKGHVYVVEFWATWCGPCIEGIPHLTKLAKQHKGKATIIGVNIWEEEDGLEKRVKDFVTKMGEKMEYTVARDTDAKVMTSSWMEAARQNGIPAAFIVDKTGTIAWIGHPMTMDEPLQLIIDGKFDVKGSREAFLQEMKEQEEMAKLVQDIEKAETGYADGRKTEALAELDAILAKQPDLAMDVEGARLRMLASDNEQGFRDHAKKLAQGDSLNSQFALTIYSVSNATEEDGNKKFALIAAETIADHLKADDPVVLFYAAPAFSIHKQHKRAITVLERALKAFDAKYAKDENMADFKKEIQDALEKEKKADKGG